MHHSTDEGIPSNPSIAIVTTDEDGQPQVEPPTGVQSEAPKESPTVAELAKGLIHFIASRSVESWPLFRSLWKSSYPNSRKCQPLWQYEDITRTDWSIRSADQIDVFLQHVLHVFQHSLPAHAHLAERWTQLALQLALSCSSRHYAGRSLQIFRSLRVPISSRMLSDILSRLVETIAEQGEDMQGYVTELILTLEAVVESLDIGIRPMHDGSRAADDIFKSTPNLSKEPAGTASGGVAGHGGGGSGAEHGRKGSGAGGEGHGAERHHATSPVGHG